MPKIIRFSSSLCTLFHKSTSHYLQHKVHKNLIQNSKHTPHEEANLFHNIICLKPQSCINIQCSKSHHNFTRILTKSELQVRKDYT
jgi:hypothetical protein